MAYSYIRFYDKPNDEGTPATWLGLDATPANNIRERGQEFFAFFQERGHTISKIDPEEPSNARRMRALGGISRHCYEIVPPLPDPVEPLSRDFFTELGTLCKATDGSDTAKMFIMDNRRDPFPTTPYSSPSTVVYRYSPSVYRF